MYTHTYDLRYSDYKDFDTVKTSSVLDIVQEVSVQHSASLGYDVAKLRELELAWLIQGIKIRFEKPVTTAYSLEASTAVKAMRGATSERGCIIRQNGEVVAKTIANWFLFDVQKGRIGKITPEMQEAYSVWDFDDDFFVYKKPDLHTDAQRAYTIRVSNKEIDTNMHLNNQKGAELLMDALPFDYKFRDMNVLYKKSAYLGDELDVCTLRTENGYYVHLMTKEKDICVAGIFEE